MSELRDAVLIKEYAHPYAGWVHVYLSADEGFWELTIGYAALGRPWFERRMRYLRHKAERRRPKEQQKRAQARAFTNATRERGNER